MKILIICSHRYYAPYTDYVAPFIYEQMQGLKNLGCEFRVCFIKGGGLKSYWQAWKNMRKMIDAYQPDIVHAHYGLCCLLANMQRKVPVVSTYHGSDINDSKIRILSKIAIRLSKKNIFVSERLKNIVQNPSNSVVIPCGVDTGTFYPMNKEWCRRELRMDMNKKYVLFSKAFNVWVKNYPLAKDSIDKLKYKGVDVELVELKGYTRQQVVWLMNACDCALMTSFNEGSPQFIKEAMACNCPIVSTNVGDVKEVVANMPDCYITAFDAEEIAQKIERCFWVNIDKSNDMRRNKILLNYEQQVIAQRIKMLYVSVL